MKLSGIEAGTDRPGTPLVILHGLFGSARNWSSIVKQMGRKRPVIALDLPNHGDSPQLGAIDYPSLARAVLQHMQDRGDGHFVVLGHSLGGKVAMTLALLWPDDVCGLIALDIAPAVYAHVFRPHIEAMRSVQLDLVKRRSDAERAMEDTIPEPAVRSFLCQNLVMEPSGCWRWRLDLDGIEAALPTLSSFPDVSTTLPFDGPTLFLKGAASDYVRADHTSAIKHLFPTAAIVEIEGAGHWVHADRPNAVIERVEGFCATVDKGG